MFRFCWMPKILPQMTFLCIHLLRLIIIKKVETASPSSPAYASAFADYSQTNPVATFHSLSYLRREVVHTLPFFSSSSLFISRQECVWPAVFPLYPPHALRYSINRHRTFTLHGNVSFTFITAFDFAFSAGGRLTTRKGPRFR